MWGVYVEDGQIFVIDGDVTVCEIADHDNFVNPAPNGMKNAHLLAAAPDLLASMEGLLNALNSHTTHPAIISARAAVAKAKGGQE